MSSEDPARTRRELLIDGRRVRSFDHIKAGLLFVGQELTAAPFFRRCIKWTWTSWTCGAREPGEARLHRPTGVGVVDERCAGADLVTVK
jgi:hypothetical protein